MFKTIRNRHFRKVLLYIFLVLMIWRIVYTTLLFVSWKKYENIFSQGFISNIQHIHLYFTMKVKSSLLTMLRHDRLIYLSFWNLPLFYCQANLQSLMKPSLFGEIYVIKKFSINLHPPQHACYNDHTLRPIVSFKF